MLSLAFTHYLQEYSYSHSHNQHHMYNNLTANHLQIYTKIYIEKLQPSPIPCGVHHIVDRCMLFNHDLVEAWRPGCAVLRCSRPLGLAEGDVPRCVGLGVGVVAAVGERHEVGSGLPAG